MRGGEPLTGGGAESAPSDAQEIAQAARSGFQEIFAGAFKRRATKWYPNRPPTC
jgi:hypothetical protein